jgi:O-antigen/teichoic acid export membrane protein
LGVVAVAVAFNLFANILVIPRYGIVGAAIVAILTNSIVGAGYLYFGRPVRELWPSSLKHYLPVLVSLALGMFLWKSSVISHMVSIPLSATIMVITVAFFGFDRLERAKLAVWKDARSWMFEKGRL